MRANTEYRGCLIRRGPTSGGGRGGGGVCLPDACASIVCSATLRPPPSVGLDITPIVRSDLPKKRERSTYASMGGELRLFLQRLGLANIIRAG